MISRVSKSQPRTPNQLEDIASDILLFLFKKLPANPWTDWASPLKKEVSHQPLSICIDFATKIYFFDF